MFDCTSHFNFQHARRERIFRDFGGFLRAVRIDARTPVSANITYYAQLQEV